MRYLLPILALVVGCAHSAPPPKPAPPPPEVTVNDCNRAYNNLLRIALGLRDEQFTPEQIPQAKTLLDLMWQVDGHKEKFYSFCMDVPNVQQVTCMEHAPSLEGMTTCMRMFAPQA
jgi:hypothetical protein